LSHSIGAAEYTKAFDLEAMAVPLWGRKRKRPCVVSDRGTSSGKIPKECHFSRFDASNIDVRYVDPKTFTLSISLPGETESSMPIYEFQCRDCRLDFEELLIRPADADSVVCPECESDQVRKRISLISSSVKSGAGTTAVSACTTST
jgi:putative FmdB family regulatory protein